MATKRGDGAEMEPTQGTPRKTSARAAGGGATGRTTRGAAKPDGPTAETSTTRRSSSARGGAAKSTSKRTSSAARTGAGAGKAAAGEGGGTGSTSRRTAGGRKPDLRKDLRDFASTRPDGWSHDDWLQFLDHLQSRGHNINDRDAIGSMLERERLALALERIPGVGPQRVRSIADRYGYLWRLRETDADQLSREADIPRPVAEKVIQGLRT